MECLEKKTTEKCRSLHPTLIPSPSTLYGDGMVAMWLGRYEYQFSVSLSHCGKSRNFKNGT